MDPVPSAPGSGKAQGWLVCGGPTSCEQAKALIEQTLDGRYRIGLGSLRHRGKMLHTPGSSRRPSQPHRTSGDLFGAARIASKRLEDGFHFGVNQAWLRSPPN